MDRATDSSSLECRICKKSFTQKPSLRRHEKRCSEFKSPNPRRKSCKHCSLAKVRCDLQRPTCSRCLVRKNSCQYVETNPEGPINLAASKTTSADPQPPTGVENEDSGPPEECQAAVSVAESIIAGSDSLPPFSLEYVDSEGPPPSSGMVSTNSDHIGHDSSMTASEIDILENHWSLQLTPSPVIPPLAKHSMEFIFRVLRTWPGMMASEIQLPPIVHISQLAMSPLPLPLANCFTLAKMWDGQRPGAEGLVHQTTVNEMTRLFVEYQSYDELNLVAALQALVIYMVILMFPKREQASVPTLDMSIFQNVQQMVYDVAQTGLVIQEERDHVRPSWAAWIHVTSKRRAVLALYLLHWSYSVLKSLPTFNCKELTFMPAPAAKTLWQMSRKDEWELAYDRWLIRWEGGGYIQQEFWEIEPGLAINSRTQKWLEEADEFGILLMSLVNATDRDHELTVNLPARMS